MSLGLSSTDSLLTCLGLNGFLYQLYFWIVMPLFLIGVIVLVSLAHLMRKRRLSLAAFIETVLPPIMRLMFLLYPSIVNKSFEASQLVKATNCSYRLPLLADTLRVFRLCRPFLSTRSMLVRHHRAAT